MTQYQNLDEVKIQVDEATEIMKNNIEKVLQRDEKLGELETKTEELVEGSRRFNKKTNKLKWKMYCVDKRLLAGFIMMLVLLIVIILIIFTRK